MPWCKVDLSIALEPYNKEFQRGLLPSMNTLFENTSSLFRLSLSRRFSLFLPLSLSFFIALSISFTFQSPEICRKKLQGLGQTLETLRNFGLWRKLAEASRKLTARAAEANASSFFYVPLPSPVCFLYGKTVLDILKVVQRDCKLA